MKRPRSLHSPPCCSQQSHFCTSAQLQHFRLCDESDWSPALGSWADKVSFGSFPASRFFPLLAVIYCLSAGSSIWSIPVFPCCLRSGDSKTELIQCLRLSSVCLRACVCHVIFLQSVSCLPRKWTESWCHRLVFLQHSVTEKTLHPFVFPKLHDEPFVSDELLPQELFTISSVRQKVCAADKPIGRLASCDFVN